MTSNVSPNISRVNLFKTQSQIWQSIPYNLWDAIYNKLRLIQSQGLECAPVGQSFLPSKYPVILKPIISMAAARQKYRVCMAVNDYQKLVESGKFAGWFWMPYLDCEEQQRCLELIILNGQPVFGYSLDYTSNPDMIGAISHINLNIPQSDKFSNKNIPGWTDILAPALKGYSGSLSLYYIGSYIISASARWTIWSEYIFQETNHAQVLDKICRILNTYKPTQDQDTGSVCLELFRQSLGPQIINLVPIYLKSSGYGNSDSAEQERYFKLAKKHWQTICNSLGVAIHWQPCDSSQDEFMPLIALVVASSVEQLKKINKYKQISQLAPVEQGIPVVY